MFNRIDLTWVVNNICVEPYFQLVLTFAVYSMVRCTKTSHREIFFPQTIRLFGMLLCTVPIGERVRQVLGMKPLKPAKPSPSKSNKARRKHMPERIPTGEDNFDIPTTRLKNFELIPSKFYFQSFVVNAEFKHFEFIMAICYAWIVLFFTNHIVETYATDGRRRMYVTSFDAFSIVLIYECFLLLAKNTNVFFRLEDIPTSGFQRKLIALIVLIFVVLINFIFIVLGNELDFKSNLLIKDKNAKLLLYIARTLCCAYMVTCFSLPGIRFGMARKILQEDLPRYFTTPGMSLWFDILQVAYLVLFGLWFTPIRTTIESLFSINGEQFETWRFYFAVVTILCRFAVFPFFVMLNMEATFRENVTELMKMRVMTTYEEICALTMKVNRSFLLGMANFTMPYIIQMIFCLRMFHRGKIHWDPYRQNATLPVVDYPANSPQILLDPQLNRDIFGFLLWWSCFIHFVLGLIAHFVNTEYLTNIFLA